jgi:hypothetical protein
MDYNPNHIAQQVGQFATEREEPEGYVYEPPPERNKILALPAQAKMYEPDAPNEHTDRLAPYERRHIIPIASLVAPIFETVPVPDDVYRAAPEFAKSNLFCVFGRTGIERNGDQLRWDAIVVVVQRLCIVRVQVVLEPKTDKFGIERMLVWSRRHQDYQPAADPQGGLIDPSVLPYILDRYVGYEEVLKPA